MRKLLNFSIDYNDIPKISKDADVAQAYHQLMQGTAAYLELSHHIDSSKLSAQLNTHIPMAPRLWKTAFKKTRLGLPQTGRLATTGISIKNLPEEQHSKPAFQLIIQTITSELRRYRYKLKAVDRKKAKSLRIVRTAFKAAHGHIMLHFLTQQMDAIQKSLATTHAIDIDTQALQSLHSRSACLSAHWHIRQQCRLQQKRAKKQKQATACKQIRLLELLSNRVIDHYYDNPEKRNAWDQCAYLIFSATPIINCLAAFIMLGLVATNPALLISIPILILSYVSLAMTLAALVDMARNAIHGRFPSYDIVAQLLSDLIGLAIVSTQIFEEIIYGISTLIESLSIFELTIEPLGLLITNISDSLHTLHPSHDEEHNYYHGALLNYLPIMKPQPTSLDIPATIDDHQALHAISADNRMEKLIQWLEQDISQKQQSLPKKCPRFLFKSVYRNKVEEIKTLQEMKNTLVKHPNDVYTIETLLKELNSKKVSKKLQHKMAFIIENLQPQKTIFTAIPS